MEEAAVQEIKQRLTQLEATEEVIILLAVESGSRAWGFESQDSDYDVRFVYLRHPDAYLSIDLEIQRDVIERPIVDGIDLSGWDIRKTLKLFHHFNPPLLEWLQSPIVYRERYAFASNLRALLPEVYSPLRCFHHYNHMARGNIREYLRGEVVWRKKYFYVLRPLLALQWLERGYGAVPMEFKTLVEKLVTDSALRLAIDELVAAKRAAKEMDRGPRIPVIIEFIDQEIAKFDGVAGTLPKQDIPLNKLNDLFRFTLREPWQKNSPG